MASKCMLGPVSLFDFCWPLCLCRWSSVRE